jgi:ribonuclease HI
LSIAELQAGLLPLEQRLRKQAIAFWVSIHKLDQSHPHWMIKRQRLCTKHRSPLMKTAEMCRDVEVDKALEVKAYACPPWVARPEVEMVKDIEQAQNIVKNYKAGQADIYVDASVRNGRAGIGIYAMPSRICVSRVVASSDQADTHFAELLAISEAANWPWSPSCMAYDRDSYPIPASSIRIFSDSQSALRSVQSWRAGACQEIVAEIIKKLQGTNVTLYWIPRHAKIEGNEKADKLAKAVTREDSEEPLQRNRIPWYLIQPALKRVNTMAKPTGSKRTEIGKFTRKIDAALHLGKSAELY